MSKATEEDQEDNPRLVDINPEFAYNAPLWYYVLAEAQQAFEDDQTPIRLGPVGGRIVGEVFVGLLWGDTHSYPRQYPAWRPIPEFLRDRYSMAARGSVLSAPRARASSSRSSRNSSSGPPR